MKNLVEEFFLIFFPKVIMLDDTLGYIGLENSCFSLRHLLFGACTRDDLSLLKTEGLV